MRELALFEQYLVQLRQEKLQKGHASALAAIGAQDFPNIIARAHEAEMVQTLIVAIRALNNDPGQFIKEYLK